MGDDRNKGQNRQGSQALGGSQRKPERPPTQRIKIPDEYFDAPAYFDGNGVIRKDFYVGWARGVAKAFEKNEDCNDSGRHRWKLTNGQLRRFYGQVKRLERRILLAADDCEIEAAMREVDRLEAWVTYQHSRELATVDFLDFIISNVRRVKTKRDMLKGFVPHFECVVGFAKLKDDRR